MLTFKEYYDECRKRYSTKNVDVDIFNEVNLHIFEKDEENYISTPSNYSSLIDEISKKISNRIDNNFPAMNEDVGIIQEEMCIKLNDFYDIEEIKILGNHFARQLEEKVYNSFSIIDHVHIYRSIHTTKEKSSSWLWHMDNSVNEQLKIMVYLTDVDHDNGPFTAFVREGKPLKFGSSKVSPENKGESLFPNGRIPNNVIEHYKSDGYIEYPIKNKKGTYILFDQNMVHRATIPKENRHRDVLIFNFRPFHKNIVDKMEFTNSWKYKGDVKTYPTEII